MAYLRHELQGMGIVYTKRCFIAVTALFMLCCSGLCRQAKAQSASKSFDTVNNLSGDRISVDAYKVVKIRDGKKIIDKQIKLTITPELRGDNNYGETFLEEQYYKCLYKALGEFVALSNKWKKRLLEEDSKTINVRQRKFDEQEKKRLREIGIDPEKEAVEYDIFADLTLDKSGYILLIYHQEGNLIVIEADKINELRKSIEEAVIWLDKPFDKKPSPKTAPGRE